MSKRKAGVRTAGAGERQEGSLAGGIQDYARLAAKEIGEELYGFEPVLLYTNVILPAAVALGEALDSILDNEKSKVDMGIYSWPTSSLITDVACAVLMKPWTLAINTRAHLAKKETDEQIDKFENALKQLTHDQRKAIIGALLDFDSQQYCVETASNKLLDDGEQVTHATIKKKSVEIARLAREIFDEANTAEMRALRDRDVEAVAGSIDPAPQHRSVLLHRMMKWLFAYDRILDGNKKPADVAGEEGGV